MKVVTRTLDHDAKKDGGAPPETAVVLLHLGGPSAEDDIERFHVALWSDAAVAPPGGERAARAAFELQRERWVAAWTHFRGRSPVFDFLSAQARALENRLNGVAPTAPTVSGKFRAFVGTRFGKPTIEEAVAAARASGAKRIVGVAMYPHASPASSGPCVAAFRAAANDGVVIDDLASAVAAAGFDEVLADHARRAFDLVAPKHRDKTSLLLAARSPPEPTSRKDPSLRALERTAQAVMKGVGFDEARTVVAFVASGGPAALLEPDVETLAVDLGKDKREAVVVVPVSVVTDDVDTLYELDVRVQGVLAEHGVKQVRRASTIGTDPRFIDALARRVASVR